MMDSWLESLLIFEIVQEIKKLFDLAKLFSMVL